jgi:hypothetical protein
MTFYNKVFAEQRAVMSMRGWIKRRRLKGLEPNANEVHQRVLQNWPGLSHDQIERVLNDRFIA